MKVRIRGIVCALTGVLVAAVGVLSAVEAVRHTTPPQSGMILVALVRHYGLRGEILLVALGLALLLAAGAILLSPGRIWVALSSEKTARAEGEDPAVSASEGGANPPKPEPRPVCYLRTCLVGSAFRNIDGSSRQHALERVAVGDVLLCHSSKGSDATETVGVFTVDGTQLGFLDAAFLRALRDRYPGCRMGIEVERMEGGHGLPYTCYLRVAVYRV